MRHFLLILFLFQFLFSNTDECLIISDSENYNSYNYFQSISIDNLDTYQDQSCVFETNIDENVFRAKGVWKEPKPVLISDGAVGRIVNGHKGNVEFSRTFLVPPKVEVDKYSIHGKLLFRACDNQSCTLPQELPFQTGILVTNQ